MTSEAEPIPAPDDKDWTWVLNMPCPECGFEAASVARVDIAEIIAATTTRWTAVLDQDDVRIRPQPRVWSALEYGCHVRDVHRLFGERITLMLAEDDPQFANWNQDETALAANYAGNDPAQVARELATAAQISADIFGSVGEDAWTRSGRRGNGSVFTVESLGRYYLHDVLHHLHDVRG